MSRRQKWSVVLIGLFLTVVTLGALEGARLIRYRGELDEAVGYRDRISVVLMVAFGADPNKLLVPIFNDEAAMVKTLLRLGADPNRVYYNGYTPLTYAASSGSKAIVDVLLAYGAKPTLLDMVFLEDTAGLRLEIEANPEQLNFEYGGKHLIHHGAMTGKVKSVEMLLELGANIDALDDGLRSPLKLAQDNEQEEMIEFLLNRGASPEPIIPESTSRRLGIVPGTATVEENLK